MQDLKKKAKLREKFAVEDDWVMPFEVIPIIDIPEFGDKAAVKVLNVTVIAIRSCRLQRHIWGVASMVSRPRLTPAHERELLLFQCLLPPGKETSRKRLKFQDKSLRAVKHQQRGRYTQWRVPGASRSTSVPVHAIG